MRIIIKILVIVITIVVVIALFLRLRYGGGEYYPNVATDALLPSERLEIVFSYEKPLGNIAVNSSNRIFFTIHPESRPDRLKLFEIVNGEAIPFPDEAAQDNFTAILGLFIDLENNLWIIDHGNHGIGKVKVFAYNLGTNELLYEHIFNTDIAPPGSFFNDLQVDIARGFVYIADVNFFGKDPAMVVHNINTGESRRILEDHPSVYPQNFIIRSPVKEMTFLGGLIALKPGIDGIVLSIDGEHIYWGAMTHEFLYRIPTPYIQDFSISEEEVENKIERVGQKPLSDGLSIDSLNNVYITDVENQGIAVINPNGELRTLVKNDQVVWADGLSFGGDGYLYMVDSEIPNQMLRSKKHMKASAPYFIYRVKPEGNGVAGR